MGAWVISLTFTCLALVSGVGCVTVSIPEPKYEFARGDNITLPCNFKSALSSPTLYIITWIAEGVKGGEDIVMLTHYSHNKRTDYHSKYDGRAKLDVDIPTGKANLKLYSITLNDNRRFVCRLQIPGDDEGTPSDPTELVVLVAPSPPICAIQGKAEYGQNINLTCRSEEGSPPPTYKWEARDVRNVLRMKDPRTTDREGIMSLYNISKDTSGYYICTSSNKIRSASCNITLAVMPPSMLGSVGQTAGIIAAVVAVVFILIIVLYCCCCKKKKEKQEEYAMGAPAEEYRDKAPTENGERQPARDEERGERDTRERRDYDDRRSDYDDVRSDYDDRRSDYDDRRSDFDDRRSDYTDRRSDYDDRRDRRYDDDRRYDSRDRRYDDKEYDDRPAVPSTKPPRRDYDD